MWPALPVQLLYLKWWLFVISDPLLVLRGSKRSEIVCILGEIQKEVEDGMPGGWVTWFSKVLAAVFN